LRRTDYELTIVSVENNLCFNATKPSQYTRIASLQVIIRLCIQEKIERENFATPIDNHARLTLAIDQLNAQILVL